ncbi:amidase [Ventosimonas gracilis]|uniref:amidase n=1 Tax=Ventosimonas gracilis TaxID=1680762 RepID=UPI0009A1DEA4
MDQLDALSLMPKSFELPWQAHQLVTLIARREISCREVMSAYLARIERLNPQVNALISLEPPERLLAEADAKDASLARGEPCGMLYGLPHAVKDLALTKGIRTTFGSPLFKDEVPQQDSIMVERLKAAGAIVIGKTNVPEFGMGSQTYNPLFGATGNAYDPVRTAGGSSGGAAAALALQLVPLADGSDMMGSLRNPAAFNNIIGMRPSQGRVPFDDGAELFCNQLGYEGPMGRCVEDVALLLSIQAGYHQRAPLSISHAMADFRTALEQRDFSGAKLGWLADMDGYLPMQSGVLELCQSALLDFQTIGCNIEPCSLNFSPQRLWDCWRVLRHWSVSGSLIKFWNNPLEREQLKPEAQWEIENGLKLSALDVYQASQTRSDWYRAICALFEQYDYLLLPSAQVFPFDKTVHWPKTIEGHSMDTYHRWMEVVIAGTLSGCPVINVPAGFNEQGLPMGIQIIGPPQDDYGLLQLAFAYEQATRWYQRRLPPLLAQ